MKLITLTVFALILAQSFANPLGIPSFKTVKNYIIGTKDITFGLIKQGTSFIPSATEVIGGYKNYLAGYPLEYVSSTINAICSALVSSESVISKVLPDVNSLNFQLITPCYKYNYSLLEPAGILENKFFDVTKKTVILVTGWRTTVGTSKTIDALSKAYHCRGDVNFLAFDAASYVDTLFTWSALNTDKLGEYLGESLVLLAKIVPLENIHLIGHSLGAHICGSAGRTFIKLTNKRLPRITGLDPAKPCFNEGENLSGLMRGQADFIDVIHTNSGVLGKKEAIGDVDFYPDGIVPLPTACLTVTCAHERAWLYYVESVYPGNENNFMAKHCSAIHKLRRGKCGDVSVPMGYATPNNLVGSYMVEVKGSSPFGKNGNKTRETQNVWCGSCLASAT